MPPTPGPGVAHPFIAAYLPTITLFCGLVGIGINAYLLRRFSPPKPVQLENVISSFVAAASIPVGVLLIAAGIDRHMLDFLSDLYLALAAAGIATIYLAVKGLIPS